MTYRPRYYQSNAIDAAISWVKSTTDNGLIEAFQGAGKSNIIAEIAKRIRDISGKQVLCLVPSAELLKQNADKFKLINEPVSLFSASAKSASLRHACVVATPMSVKNKISRFKDQFSAIILDEADRSLTPTILSIIDHLRTHNPRLRVLGLTGTPFTMKNGCIYELDVNNKPIPESKTNDPFFKKQIFKIGRKELTDEGFLVPIVFGETHAEKYDTSKLQLNSMNKYDTKEIHKVFVGHGRKTAAIVADVVERSKDRNSVIFFSATVKHAEEILASLPAGISSIVTGNKSPDREKIIRDYKAGKIRYIVNCEVLTVGFDDPKTDTIAILRKTESSSLYLQICGRAVRPLYSDGFAIDTKEQRLEAINSSGKTEALILDYTDNFEFHFPDHDIDNPQIKPLKSKQSGSLISVICPLCNTENEFTARKNDDGFAVDDNGYFIDLMGERIVTDFGPMPAHYGRRCFGQELIKGQFSRCNYRWTSKPCPHCEADNDIAARYCYKCKGEIIDPNQKLIADFQAMKKDPYEIQCDKVVTWHQKKTLTKKGEDMLVIDWITESRKFPIFYLVRRPEYGELMTATQGGDVMPKSVTYRKDKKSGFFRVLAYNQDVVV